MKRHVGELAGQAEALHFEHDRRIGGHRSGGREHVRDFTSGHETDELGGGGVCHRDAGCHRSSVFEDRDAVADLPDLLQAVRDVDDSDALGGQLLDDVEEVLDLLGVEHGRGLVHDDQLDVVREGACHADDLLVRRAEVADLGVRGQVRVAEPAQQLLRLTRGLGPLRQASPRELVPEEDVLGDRQAVDDVQLLVHRGDAELERGLGRGDLDGLAEPGDRAAVGAVDAGERLDEGRLAGAVLSEHAVHFSGTDVEVHPAQGMDAREALGGTPDFE